jgi:hypothetical protein
LPGCADHVFRDDSAMSDGKSDCASTMTLLREVVRRPRDYGLDYRHASLTNVLEFAVRATVKRARCGRSSAACKPRTSKRVRRDRDGNTWMIKYHRESVMNPVLASIFTRLSGCPGAEVCPSFLDYDRRAKQPCSVQPYIRARRLPRLTHFSRHGLSRLIDGDRRRASQILCQAVGQWILDNLDGHQVIIDEFGDCVRIDHDQLFFIENRQRTKDWQKLWARRSKARVSAVRAELIEATARVPGVLEDLGTFVARVEAIPAAAYEGLVRNASFRVDQLCGLFYLDTMGSRALGSVEALEQWIAHLLVRKPNVRSVLARRLRKVLGNAECRL